jgi:tetratricopeptide (TPR) repeat protein
VAREHLENDVAKGIADYQQASRLNPRHPWPWINLCEDHIKADETTVALDECAKANELQPSPIAFRLLGFAHLKRGELDAAIAAYDQAIKMYANYDSALYGRGLARKRKGDQSGGEADIAAAMSINPKVGEDIKRNFGIQ